MCGIKSVKFNDNQAATSQPDRFVEIYIDIKKVIESWRLSVFSFEWLTNDGHIKSPEDLSCKDQQRRQNVMSLYNAGEAVMKPVLGIGVMDNVEVGSGREVLLCLAELGVETMPVHIPKTNIKDFEKFIFMQEGE